MSKVDHAHQARLTLVGIKYPYDEREAGLTYATEAQAHATLALVEAQETANLLKLHELSGRLVPSWGSILERMGFREQDAPKAPESDSIVKVMALHLYNSREVKCGCGKPFRTDLHENTVAAQHRHHVAEKIAEAMA